MVVCTNLVCDLFMFVSVNGLQLHTCFLQVSNFWLLFVGCSSSCVHELIGFGMYYFSYSTWEGLTVSVEDLYVKKEHRQNNVGTALLQRIAQFAIEHDCHRLAWNHTNGNEPAFQFFKHHKAILLPEWKKMYLDNPTLTALADEVTS